MASLEYERDVVPAVHKRNETMKTKTTDSRFEQNDLKSIVHETTSH